MKLKHKQPRLDLFIQKNNENTQKLPDISMVKFLPHLYQVA